jgi:hypothetical protein
MGLFFYRQNPIKTFIESFDNWPGTIPDASYYVEFSFDSVLTISIADSFETSEGWVENVIF